MKQYKSLFVVIHLLVLFVSSKCDISSENQTTADVRAISTAQNTFCRDFYLALAEGNEGNLFFSPFSLSAAFGMLQMGSQGNTEAEVKDVFHYPENKLQIRRGYKALLTGFSSENANYTLKTVNKMYLEETFPIKEEFGTALKDDFLSEVEKVSFRTNYGTVRNEINDYVKNYTNSKIKDLLPEGSLDSLTKLVLVNAIYFKANWEKKFNKSLTHDGQFWVNNSKSFNVSMMETEDNFYYSRNYALNSQILKLNYKGNECAFYAILPIRLNGLSELEGKLSSLDLQDLESELEEKRVKVQLPKFSLEQNVPLMPKLKEMGVRDAFGQGVANFSSIVERSNLYVSNAFHKSFIEVDEEGSEAAAATAIVFGTLSLLEPIIPSFKADHPFLFFIKHIKTNSILFAGRVVNPN